MKYRKLGRAGFDVSEMGDGLWGMSGWSGSDDEESLKSMQLAVDLGCNFFDTAWAYGEGKSDEIIRESLMQAIGHRERTGWDAEKNGQHESMAAIGG